MSGPSEWLKTTGEEWRRAAGEAAERLLISYREKFGDAIPVDLHLLAKTLDSTVVRVRNMRDDAKLLPVRGGFQILVRDDLRTARGRTAIAHELCHTLFYAREEPVPKRLNGLDAKAAGREEAFCFDAGRRVLAPDWAIKQLGLATADADVILTTLTRCLNLSRDIAARAMLEDHALVEGVAHKWVLRNGEWKIESGHSFVSNSLKARTKEIKLLHQVSLGCLMKGVYPRSECSVVAFKEPSGDAAFVIVQVFSLENLASRLTRLLATIDPQSMFPMHMSPRRAAVVRNASALH